MWAVVFRQNVLVYEIHNQLDTICSCRERVLVDVHPEHAAVR